MNHRFSLVQNLYRFEFVVFKIVLWLSVLGDMKSLPHACHMNSVVRQMWEQNTDVVMVDTGNSYEGLCEYVGGKYISYTEEHPITMNPFKIKKENWQRECSVALFSRHVAGGSKPKVWHESEDGSWHSTVSLREEVCQLSSFRLQLHTKLSTYGRRSYIESIGAIWNAASTRCWHFDHE